MLSKSLMIPPHRLFPRSCLKMPDVWFKAWRFIKFHIYFVKGINVRTESLNVLGRSIQMSCLWMIFIHNWFGLLMRTFLVFAMREDDVLAWGPCISRKRKKTIIDVYWFQSLVQFTFLRGWLNKNMFVQNDNLLAWSSV